METLQVSIGLRVRHLRMERHLTAKAFAALIGWQPDYLSRFEQGKWRHVEPGKFIALADTLRIPLDELVGRGVADGIDKDEPGGV